MELPSFVEILRSVAYVAIAVGLVIAAFALLCAGLVAYANWQLRRLEAKMTPEQRVGLACHRMAEAIRRNQS